jgi:DegV family protein with EDD domain
LAGIRVVTDTACDLPQDLVDGLGLGLVSLRIRFGDEEFVDRVELSSDQFWSRCTGFGGLPSTAAPSPGQFQEAFERMRDDGADAVVCVSLSSRLSATIEAARQAARTLEPSFKVVVVDSLSVSLGQGLIAVQAAEAAASGASIEEVAASASASASALKLYGTIDTLENLKKGGRIGNAQALLGSLLSIKPVIEVRDGIVEEESKQRTRKRSLRYLADKALAAGPVARMAVLSAQAPDLDELVEMLSEVETSKPLLIGQVGPVIGSHAGPRAIGVTWIPRET